MMEFILYFVFEIIIVELLGWLIGLKFRMIFLIGVVLLKLLTFRKESIYELADYYKGSIKPYFLGFLFLIVVGVLVVKLIR